MKEILKLDHIQKYYGNGGNVTKAIQDISFSVQEGEFVGIMGASGSGKTTPVSYTHLDVYKRQAYQCGVPTNRCDDHPQQRHCPPCRSDRPH